jgi:molybdopterin molybdotransferase
MTGAPLPEGADTVIMQEVTQTDGPTVKIYKAGFQGSNIRRAGEDIKKGDLLFQAGTKLRPGHIGILASTKRACISVYQRPRVAILSTGDELVDIDEELTDGKIVTSNSYSLSALVIQNDGIPITLGIARDTKQDLRQRLREGLHADIILSSGGVSVGDYDFVKDVLADFGIDMKFWKVAMRPGQPLAFGTIEGKPTFGLPGNPVSVMVSFEQFVKPVIRKMSGYLNLFGTIIEAISQEKITTQRGKKYFIRCRVTCKNGSYEVSTTGEQGSGILMSMAAANGLIIVPEDMDIVNSGDRVKVQILDPEFGFTEKPGY